MPMTSQLLLISNHPLLSEGMKALLRKEPGLRISCDPTGGRDFVELINSTIPDAVLVDLTLNTSANLELIEAISKQFSNLAILAWTIVPDTLQAERPLAAGARGFLEADAIPRDLSAALRKVLNGGIFVDTAVADRLIRRSIEGEPISATGRAVTLSHREIEVFRGLGQGLTTQEIALRLHISPETVESHRFHIREKLGLRNNSCLIREATRWAIQDDRALVRS